MKHLFTCGIFFMMGEVAFAGGFFLRHLLDKHSAVAVTLTLVVIILIKMLEIEDRLFQ